MSSKRQLRSELADAQTTISALRATVAAANEDRDRADDKAEHVKAKLGAMTRRAENLAADLAAERRKFAATEAKLAEATTQLAERGQALRIALEQSAQVPVLRDGVASSTKRATFWRDTVQHQMRRAEAMTRVGDRMAAKADTQTAKEWAAAKEGRSLRGPDGRWLKAEGPPP